MDADRSDPLRGFRDCFALPEGVIYLDGNSLGPLPRATAPALGDMIERQWGERLIGGKIARLIGAGAQEVIAADATSANLFKLIVAALGLDPARKTVVSELGNF